MTFPVLIETLGDQYSASLVGVSNVRVVEPTRPQAILALEEKIQQRIERGELLSLEVNGKGVSGLAGKYKDDPTLEEICEEIYQARDAESNL